MHVFSCRDASRNCFMIFALLALFMLSSLCYASDSRFIWQSREQFVALEHQDAEPAATVKPNDHPVDLSLERLVSMLGSITVRPSDSEKPDALFTPSALQLLAPHLQKGLSQASPGEDVTFAIIGLHDALYGLAKSQKVTTGRLFYKAGKLNLIVGLVQKDVNDREDRRLHPFTPGSRQYVSNGDWTLLTDKPLVRRDWVAFGDEWQPSVVPAAAVDKNPAHAQQTAPQPVQKQEVQRKPADRLVILNDLKQKGLITEDEYRAKRLEILNGI